jgi:NACHT domain
MRGARRSRATRRTGVITVVLLFATTAAVLVLALVYHLGVPATLVAVLIGVPALWLAWIPYRDSQRRSAEVTTLGEVADQFAAALGAQWEKEAAVRRLNDPYPLPVSWVAADAALADDWELLERVARSGAGWPSLPSSGTWAAGPDELAGGDRELVHALTQVPTGRLVVLGEPGAGKTMLMVRLVLDLLARRARGGPVPILVSLASWNPAQEDLRSWLSGQLIIDHPSLDASAGPGMGQGNRVTALMDAGLLVPILDGLDEIPDAVRGTAIARMNEALRPGEKVVVTCRVAQYAAAVRPMANLGVTLHAAAVVQLSPLSPEAVSSYLRDAGGPLSPQRWDTVVTAMGSAAPVGQALKTPLMVGLARAIYNPRPGELTGSLPDPAELCDIQVLPDKISVEHHLFDAFIPAAYRAMPDRADMHSRYWTAMRVEPWLVFLARHLECTVRRPDFSWWELERAMPRTVTAMAAAVATVLGIGLALVATTGTGAGLTPRLWFGLTAGLAAGAAIAFMGHGARSPLTGVGWAALPIRLFRFARSPRMWRGRLRSMISNTGRIFLLAVPVVAVAALLAGLNFGIIPAAVWLLLGVLTLGVHGTYGDLGDVASPGAVLARDRRSILPLGLVALIAGPGTGFVLGTAIGRLTRLVFGTADASALGGRAGLAAGLAFAAVVLVVISAWPRWLVVCGSMALQRRLPWQLMAFLDDAHRRGVLRQAGAVYQFRHLELQHRLATRHAQIPAPLFEEQTATPSSSPST